VNVLYIKKPKITRKAKKNRKKYLCMKWLSPQLLCFLYFILKYFDNTWSAQMLPLATGFSSFFVVLSSFIIFLYIFFYINIYNIYKPLKISRVKKESKKKKNHIKRDKIRKKKINLNKIKKKNSIVSCFYLAFSFYYLYTYMYIFYFLSVSYFSLFNVVLRIRWW